MPGFANDARDHNSPSRVLDGGAGEREAHRGVEPAPRRLMVALLSFLMFCASSRTAAAGGGELESLRRIGGDDDVALGDGAARRQVARRAVEEQHAQVGGEARGFAHPVRGHRGGAHDERRRRPLRLLPPEQKGERRDRLPEPHVVGEDPPGPERLERRSHAGPGRW